MIVVSNTSPLTNLAAIGQFDLLRQLYGQVYLPEGVWAELNAKGQSWPGRNEVARVDWMQRHQVQNRNMVTVLRRDLDRGEAETIVLAVELNADLILLDEKEGRHVAQRLGLRPVGVIGILLEAKASGLVAAIAPHLTALRQTAGFYLSEAFYQFALDQAGETGP